MRTVLILAEKPKKEYLIEIKNQYHSKNIDILPLSLDIKIFLYKNNFENILSTTKLFGIKDHKLSLKITQRFRSFIRDNIKKIDTYLNSYISFSTWISNIVIFRYFNNLLFKFLVIKNLIKNNNHDHFIFYGFQSQLFIEHVEKIQKNNNFIFLDTDQSKNKIFIFSKFLKFINNLFLVVYSKLDYIDIKDSVILSSINYNFLNLKSKKKIIYLSEEGISLFNLIKIKFKHNINTKFLSIYSSRSKKEYLNQILDIGKNNEYKFNFFRQYLFEIKKEINDEIYNLEIKFLNFKRLTKKSSPHLFISPFSFGLSGLMGEYFNKENINSFCIPHGTCKGNPSNNYEYLYNLEIAEGIIKNNFKFISIQSKYSESACDYFNPKIKKVYTGPICFSKKSFTSVNKNNFLYASTFKSPNNTKFFGVETYDEYLETLSDLIKLFSNLEYNLIIQPHPTLLSYINYKSLKKFLNIKTNNIYLSEKSFHENLEISNVLISYSSTTLEESLLSHKPVIIYDKWNRYNHMSDIINRNLYEINYFNNLQDMRDKLKIIYKNSIVYEGIDINLKKYHKQTNIEKYID